MASIRLIATDVDGTLLPEGHSNLPAQYYDVIRALKDRGVSFAIASGRGCDSIEKLFEPVSRDLFFMANNGAELVRNGEYLFQSGFALPLLEEIQAFLPEIGAVFAMTATSDASYTDSRDEAFIRRLEKGYDASWVRTENMLDVGKPIQKLAACTKGDAMVEAKKAARHFSGKAEVYCAGAHWVDFIPVGVSKGRSLQMVQKLLGVGKEETIAFGDNHNDISMLQCAGTSYAVAEAREAVREAADVVLGSLREDAVLGVLRTLL